MNQSSRQAEDPVRGGLTTAALARTGEKAITIDDRLDRERNGDDAGVLFEEENPLSGQPAPYPGPSNGNPRLVAADPAEIQSAQDAPHSDATPSSERLRAQSDSDHPAAPLFSTGESKDLNARWDSVQAAFVDEPRQAVKRADELVATAMQRLAEVFAEERARLEEQWNRGDSVSTEDLRVALQRYRSFFRRLLAV